MSKKSTNQLSLFGPTSFAEDSHAKIYPSPENVQGWLEEEAAFGKNTVELSLSLNRSGSSWKMYPDFFQAKREEILPSLFEGWMNSGMWGFGKLLTVNTLEFPKDGEESSLSAILEENVHPKYFLSPKACAGILRRAERRGKALPPMLLQALRGVAGESSELESQEDKTRLCVCPTECDCQSPDTEPALCSMHCPDHNLNPKPYPDCPIHG